MNFGTNFSCIGGNSNIPNGYFLKKPELCSEAASYVKNLNQLCSINYVRTILWPTEHSSNNTDWLHIPLTTNEVSNIQKFVFDCYPVVVELAWGPLWDALWNVDMERPNKFNTLEELKSAHVDSFNMLVNSGPNPLRYQPNVRFDLWNEKDPRDNQDDIFNLIYPEFANTCNQATKDFTVSTMIAPDGDYQWAEKQLKTIQEKRFPEPKYIELHWNGSTSAIINKKCEKAISKISKVFKGKRIMFGELDCLLDAETVAKVVKAIPHVFPLMPIIIYWQKSGESPNT